MKQELELGRRTQADFLPEHVPQPDGWEIAAVFHPAREVAGDFYDVFPLPANRIGLVIADVCDKGVGAALFMVMIRSLIRAFAEQAEATSQHALESVTLTNRYIAHHHHHHNTRIHMFATLFFGVLDPSSGTLSYVNGGHEPPVIIGKNGIKAQLEPTGPAVGFMAHSQFAIDQITFEPDDIFFAYTDGVTEARDSQRELFGEDPLFALLNEPTPSVAVLMERVTQRVKQHIGEQPNTDDITMLAAKRMRS